MAFKKGESGNPNGRKKGVKNKLTEMKQIFPEVFERIGGIEAFSEWAEGNREIFYKLFVQILPKEHKVDGGITHQHTHESVSETAEWLTDMLGASEKGKTKESSESRPLLPSEIPPKPSRH